MNPTQQWVHEAEAAELLAISKSTIRAMRRDGRLEPGDHCLFPTRTAGGPVVYNIPAVIQHLAQVTTALTVEMANEKQAEIKRRQAEIEIFSMTPGEAAK